MKTHRIVLSLVLLAIVFCSTQSYALTVSATDGVRAASADFEIVGSNLQVTLTNTSTVDVTDPTHVLTAVFFDLPGNVALTPISALLPAGTTVFFGSDGGGNVGGEWAYAAGLSGAPHGAPEGISSSGFGVFGQPNFNGSNLQGPDALDGLQYGITSAVDNPATGNAPVTGGYALIVNSVVFTLAGLPEEYSLDGLSNVSFQYGTALLDTNLTPPVPEPASMALLSLGLGGLVIRRFRKVRA